MRIYDHNKERLCRMDGSMKYNMKRTVTILGLIKMAIRGCEFGVSHSEGALRFNCKARLRSWSFFQCLIFQLLSQTWIANHVFMIHLHPPPTVFESGKWTRVCSALILSGTRIMGFHSKLDGGISITSHLLHHIKVGADNLYRSLKPNNATV